MSKLGPFQGIPLPNDWPQHIKLPVIHSVALAHRAITYTRSFAIDSSIERVRLAGELDIVQNENALLQEEIRIKDARMAKLLPQRRPQYAPQERMAILELRAARAWNLAETARTFIVEPETIASWMKRAADANDRLLQLSRPVNKYPDYVRYIIQRLKALCPTMGKVRIAQMLARAGLCLGATTVGRIVKEAPLPGKPVSDFIEEKKKGRVVTARYPGHVWHVDMTTVPTAGFWVPWAPFCLAQVWPFCWWVIVVIDHFSRTVIGFAVFKKQPTADEVTAFMTEAVRTVGSPPRHLISDQGSQFTSKEFRGWCSAEPRNIKQRFGAVGEYGSIAIIERLMRSIKDECTRRILVPLREDAIRREITFYIDWYNQRRPHQSLGGRIPMEVYFGIEEEIICLETRGENAISIRLVV
ncbi:MAG: DDE-type integrase/transposase/recombinase, partial [Phycisphaerae bacterium]|nr:DDE-type integrase/transposase/recombinase [Phycisphaerae bacterium]